MSNEQDILSGNRTMKKVIFTIFCTVLYTFSYSTNYYSIAGGAWSNSRGGASCGCSPPVSLPAGDTVFVDRMSCNDPSQPTSTSCTNFDDVSGCHSVNISTLNGAIMIEPGGFLLNSSGFSVFGHITVEAGGYLDGEGAMTVQAGGTAIVDGGLDWNGSLTVNPGGSVTGTGGVRCCGSCVAFGTLNVSGQGCAACAGGGIGTAPPIGSAPVDLLSFSGQLRNNQIHLNWITLTEENNDFFYITRFTSNGSSVVIAEINGHGNTNSPISYSYYDNHEIGEITYYELTQVDFDGKETKLKTIAINNKTEGGLKVYPNPTANILNYQVLTNSEIITSEIYDQHGRRMFISFENDFINHIYVENYADGIYYLKITTASKVYKSKFIVSH